MSIAARKRALRLGEDLDGRCGVPTSVFVETARHHPSQLRPPSAWTGRIVKEGLGQEWRPTRLTAGRGPARVILEPLVQDDVLRIVIRSIFLFLSMTSAQNAFRVC